MSAGAETVTSIRLPGRYGALLAAALCLQIPMTARAEMPCTASEGISAGHFVLYPSVTFEYTDDDNIFYRSEETPASSVIGSGIFVMRPRLMVDLPIGTGKVRWAYSPVYRKYQSDSFRQSNRLSHFFDLEASRSGPVLSVRATDRLVRGTLELQEVDQGGEVVFGVTPFTTHSPELEFTVKAGARSGLSLLPRYSTVRFDEQGQAAFFNYRRKEIEGRFNHAISEPTQLYAYYAIDRTDQEREQIIFGDVSLEAKTFGVGLRRTVNKEVVTSVSAGYKSIHFRGGSGSDFAGPVLDANTTWQVGDATQISLTAGRQAYQSFFVNNNYYIDTEANLRLLQQIGQKTFLEVQVGQQNNAYADFLDISVTPDTAPGLDCNSTTPDPMGNPVCVGDGRIDSYEAFAPSVGRRRRDQVGRVVFGIGWQPVRSLRLFIGYNGERRRSNIEQLSSGQVFDPFDYSVNRIVFRIEAGWL